MKKISQFLKKYKAWIITVVVLIIVVAGIAIGLDQKEKHKWKKHPVAPYSFEFIADNDDMSVMRDRILKTMADDKLDVTEILADINEDGSFKSIDYKSDRKDTWLPLNHLEKIHKLQIAYYSEGNKFYHNEEVKNAVTKGMINWAKNDYKCEWNWWYNVVGVGKHIPDILLYGVDGLDKATEDKLLANIKDTLLQSEKVFYGAPSREVDSSGGNLTDQVLSTMKVAIVEKDGNTMKWLTHLLERELHPFPDYKKGMFRADCVGIKSDGSFQQHDQLIYFGGYGEVFADGMNKYLEYTKDTQYALNDEALNLYADFILNGMQFVTRGGYREINASGRGISRKNALKGVASQCKSAAEVLLTYNNIKRASELQNMIDTRFASEKDAGAKGHRYFYESDYQIMNNANYMASVRAASDRTRIYEFLNGENPKAYYTGMGATFFYVNGDEYYNVLPLYDWNKIPGTTTRQGFLPYKDENFSYNQYGITNKISGVSNGKLGMSYIQLKDNDVSGKKAYFMFDDAVVCLGNSLKTSKKEALLTNINQANFMGEAIVGGKTLKLGDKMNGKFDYIYHNNIGYITDADIEISAEHVDGDWKTINERFSKPSPISGDKFTLSIPHKDKNASYAYTVLMNTDAEKTKAYAENPRYVVVANTKECQAVLDTETNTIEAVFHKAGEISYADGKTLSVNKPCCIIVDGSENITASSYNGKEADMKITLNGKEYTLPISKASKTVAK